MGKHGNAKDGTTAASRRLSQVANEQRSAMEAISKASQDAVVGAKTKAEFLKLLKLKFGNVPRAWRCHLDADGNGLSIF